MPVGDGLLLFARMGAVQVERCARVFELRSHQDWTQTRRRETHGAEEAVVLDAPPHEAPGECGEPCELRNLQRVAEGLI